MVSAVLLIAITLTATVLVGTFLTKLTTNTSSTIKNQTEKKLECSFADFYIVNTTLDCNSNCSDGITHRLNVTVRNNGQVKLTFTSVEVETDDHTVYSFTLNDNVSTGQEVVLSAVFTSSCTPLNQSVYKVYLSPSNCPTIRDQITEDFVTYVNC